MRDADAEEAEAEEAGSEEAGTEKAGTEEWDAQRALAEALVVLREAAERTRVFEASAQRETIGSGDPSSDDADSGPVDDAGPARASTADPILPVRGPGAHREPDRRSVPLADGRSASAMFARLRLEWDLESRRDADRAERGGSAAEG